MKIDTFKKELDKNKAQLSVSLPLLEKVGEKKQSPTKGTVSKKVFVKKYNGFQPVSAFHSKIIRVI